MNNQSFNSYNSLPRSSSSMASSVNSTPTSSVNRTPLPPRGFGTNNYVLKDDIDKERARWQKELADAEAKLCQFSIINTELTQAKAQLNKKIIDIEKNQKPMVECNRRLAERNKTLMDSCKNFEETISFLRDEKLTLKDQYDRLIKENSSLREQRAFPEKLEELERYRSQVLEYSKCITALRQSLVDKERRHEMLIQKLRKIKKALTVRKDDDEQSERSVGSSIALDTIAEDLDEDPALMVSGDIQPTIYEQLEVATAIMNELRALFPDVDCVNDEKSVCLISKVAHLQEDYKTLNEKYHMLELELANARDSSDLFEFQLVELTSAKADVSFATQSCETDEFVNSEIIQDEPKLNFDDEFIETTKASLNQLINLFALKTEHKEAIHNGISCIMGLEHKLSFAHHQLEMAQCEIKRVNKLIEETSASSETSSRKKKELKLIIERLKVESETHAKEMSALQSNSELIKRQLEHAEAEKENFRKSLEESTEKINAVVESLQQANNMVEDYKNRLKKNDEQIEFLELELKTSSRLREEKELIEAEIAKLCFKVPNNGDFRNSDESSPQSLKQLAEIKRHLLNYDDLEKKLEGEKRDVLQLRKFNKELTEQFNSQMDIIVELKKRYLDLNAKQNENSKSHESISWTSSGSSDEQYHTEETRSEEAYDGVFPKKIIA